MHVRRPINSRQFMELIRRVHRLPPTDLSLYEEHLEAPLLEASRSHYRQQSREWLEEDNCMLRICQ